MILVVGTATDPHVMAVTRRLEALGDAFWLLDPYEAGSDLLRFSADSNVVLTAGFRRLIPDNIRSIWWRMKPYNNVPTHSVEALYDYHFRQREWNHFLDVLEDIHPSAYWMNDRQASRRASNKIRQLRIAQSIGLNIPRTIVTNNADALLEFSASLNGKDLVFKTQTSYTSPTGSIAYTSPIRAGDIPALATSLAACPAIFQERIEKRHELRVTIVGRQLFTAKIRSDHSPRSAIDWRADIFADIYEPTEIDDAAEALLLTLHKRLGLAYGAYDLIVDQNGEYVFLEVNPSGQWLWIEQAIGLGISAQISLALSQGRDAHAGGSA